MKTLTLMFACFAAVSLQLSGQGKPFKVGESDSIPENGFQNFNELKKWASSSSFGGGKSGVFTLAGNKIYFTNRCFTSGLATSEVTLYTQRASGKIDTFIALPMALREHRVAKKGDRIVITAYDGEAKAWIDIMSIGSAMFTASSLKIN